MAQALARRLGTTDAVVIGLGSMIGAIAALIHGNRRDQPVGSSTGRSAARHWRIPSARRRAGRPRSRRRRTAA